MTITKGEAQARMVAVTADAEAQRTTLEGNAEAGITFTKGEAEAKALALRADAYRQFNEAAIIQTVLVDDARIVRAAAEPMGNIENLTVLSNDGAVDLVRTATRTVTEANATVKGLTGIDVPQLLNDALGGNGQPSAEPSRPAARAVVGDGGRGGSAPPAAEEGPGAPADSSPPATAGADATTAPSDSTRSSRSRRREPPTSTPKDVGATLAAADDAIRRADETTRQALAGPAPVLQRRLRPGSAARRLSRKPRGGLPPTCVACLGSSATERCASTRSTTPGPVPCGQRGGWSVTSSLVATAR